VPAPVSPSSLVVLGSLTSSFNHWVEHFSGPWLYIVVAALTFAETGTLLFFIPGEVTLVFAGITAGAGGLNLPLLIVVACVAALLGDAFGFWLGDRFGDGLKTSRLGSKLGVDNWHRAEQLIRRRRGLVVLFGRWIGMLRAVMPAAAGMSTMSYRREFLPYDLIGATSWATVCVLGGYKLGDNAETLLKYIGWAGATAVVVLALYVVAKKRLTKRLS
jgi:membrane protein DedA with SNARE-associated domain